MGVKGGLKAVIGQERLSAIKGVVCHYACSLNFTAHRQKKIRFDSERLRMRYELTNEKYHIFRGYYDIDYLNSNRRDFLCHRLPINAGDNKTTACEVGFYDLSTGKYKKIADTRAWCWQQGSRLRWLDQDQVIFNDTTEKRYCASVYNVRTGKQVDCIDWPLYDFTPDFKYGLTLNYSRLQRLRPGYGYNYFEDTTAGMNAPEDDGIALIDLAERKCRLLYSLRRLSDEVENGEEYVHYVNHICVSPDGMHFIFFHIYVKPGVKGWQTVLYVSDMQGHELKALEKEDRVSHYCWIDNENLMVTCRKANGKEYYCTFDIHTGKKKILQAAELCVDGHPSRIDKTALFLTDTYPQKNSIQMLRTYHMTDSHAKTIASIYHDYRLRGEKRCDLHPSIAHDNSIVSVDTTYHGKRRSIVIFEM